ncbi:TOMM precursor leader peptide-binding protein [Streptomyces nigrescens]|uniref:TOMM precursor leader peptide-binding protein n=1 Tax=Streptomyces nigrescens TaxID=1920 RepID=UPI0036759052
MNNARPLVSVLGEGRLRDAVATHLAADPGIRCVSPDGPPEDPTAVVVVADAWLEDAVALGPEGAAAVLPVSTELGHVVIGPLTRPGRPGCWMCARLRRSRNHPERDLVLKRNQQALASRPSSWLTSFAVDAVAALVHDEITALAEGAGPRTASSFLRVSLADLTVRTHRVLPDPLCPACGELPEDTAEAAVLSLTRRLKPAPGAYRTRAVADARESLLSTYVDSEAGLVSEVQTGDEGGLPVAKAPLAMRGASGTEAGWGRSDSYRVSTVTAVLEAVERWGGLQAGGKRTAVRAAYREVRELAVDPVSLGLYGEERYADPDFPFTPFHDALELRWVWAYSFRRRRSVLVPETYAYYGAHVLEPDEPRLAYEISNGCALGGCIEEATLYGLLEVAERDAFLMAWYGQRPLPVIDLASARDPRLRLLAAHLEEENDRTITVLDTTVEQNIPCVWAIAVGRPGDTARARAVCAGGSHIDPERAVLNALCELGPILASVDRSYEQRREHVTAMTKDSQLVRTMGDHSLLYAAPEVFDRLAFLFASQEGRSLPEMAAKSVRVSPDDLTQDVEQVIGRYLETGLDVLVVDQTTPEHRSAALACVKVIVPGTVPMTFGHGMRRVHGLPRLFDVPRLLGDRNAPATIEDLNPHPHPFP